MYKIINETEKKEENKNEDDEWELEEDVEDKILNVEILEMKKNKSNSIFERDFKFNQPLYSGKPVWFFPEMEGDKESIFWHLTHREDKKTGERLPDMRRCERLPWIKAVIENRDKPELLNWDYKEGDGSVKTYLWLK